MYTLLLASTTSVPLRAVRLALFALFVWAAWAVHFEMDSPFLEFGVVGAVFLALDMPLSKLIGQTSVFKQMQTRKELPAEATSLILAAAILQVAVWVRGGELGIPLEAAIGSVLWFIFTPIATAIFSFFSNKRSS